MINLVFLDAGPLGLVTNPRESDESRRCMAWLKQILAGGARVIVPEIADYEVRRELIRAGRPKGIARLDALAGQLDYLAIDTAAMRRAAESWAKARNEGFATADPKALDADVILAAQATLAAEDGRSVVVATTNPGHLGRFIDARPWQDIEIEAVPDGE